MNTKIDLSFKVKEMNFIGKIIAKDSIDYYIRECKLKFTDMPNTPEDILKVTTKELKGGEHVLDSIKAELINLKSKGKEYQYLQDVADRFEPSIKLMRRIHDCLTNYISTPEMIIGNKWKCTYSIVNPMLNNAKQEITNIYLFNGNNSKLISRLTD